MGYQQYGLYPSPKVAGHYIWRMTFPAYASYQVDLYAVSYRTWDMNTARWSDWTTKGSFGNDVHFAQFVIERRNGVWNPRGTIYMQPMGAELRSVDCSTTPPLD